MMCVEIAYEYITILPTQDERGNRQPWQPLALSSYLLYPLTLSHTQTFTLNSLLVGAVVLKHHTHL